MKSKRILLAVAGVVVLAVVVVFAALSGTIFPKEPEMSEELMNIDPTDMSQYYAMGEYYPPNSVDSLNVDWQGGRVEIVAYNGDDYFVEEASTRYLQENERLTYTLDNNTFSVAFASEETEITDAYKKVEIRIPRKTAGSMKSINIKTDGEVVLKNITAESITVNGRERDVVLKNTYSGATSLTTTDGKVSLFVKTDTGYSVDFSSKDGKLDSYVDNGMNSYVNGDGKYPFKVKTKTGDLNVSLYEEEQ